MILHNLKIGHIFRSNNVKFLFFLCALYQLFIQKELWPEDVCGDGDSSQPPILPWQTEMIKREYKNLIKWGKDWCKQGNLRKQMDKKKKTWKERDV